MTERGLSLLHKTETGPWYNLENEMFNIMIMVAVAVLLQGL